ncbi:cytochrome c5 family protein [Moritella sp. 24]|uniref:c-type cytochrome n=1 Tax=Moritella sp. 24 TaxID=2746230 RepID=UPI001BAC4A31|nr:cytochrome c5 family protein [Moritella sp. 24]QUM78371.1 cytochrome c5 family protein [Moritella sp. 24]
MYKLRNILITLSASLLFVFNVSANHNSAESIEERIAPVGQVYLPGELAPVVAKSTAPAEPRSGEQVYTATCNMCHGSGLAGAPIKGNADQWAPRIAQGKETLYRHAIEGLNGAMPARGTCSTCSDDELQAAVDFMIQGL